MGTASEPSLTVVIGSNAPSERLKVCLEALEPQRDGVEVLVREGEPSPLELQQRFPWASFNSTPGLLVPEHWRDGIDAATGEIVALTIAQMIPAPDWIATIRSVLADREVAGGAIDPGGDGMRLVDWAEYFCRYSRDLRPFPERLSLHIPGDNAAYRRVRLESVREVYRHGFWEPFVHARLQAEGVEIWQTPHLLTFQGRSAGFQAFTRQRVTHGRQYARDRSAGFSTPRTILGIAASPAIPILMTLRVVRPVFRKRRYRMRLVAALPLLFWFNVAWAYAEARGYADRWSR